MGRRGAEESGQEREPAKVQETEPRHSQKSPTAETWHRGEYRGRCPWEDQEVSRREEDLNDITTREQRQHRNLDGNCA